MSTSERRALREGLFKLEFVCICVHLVSSDTVKSVWETTSLHATLVSMVTGRVEVSEEVERTGCSEAEKGRCLQALNNDLWCVP